MDNRVNNNKTKQYTFLCVEYTAYIVRLLKCTFNCIKIECENRFQCTLTYTYTSKIIKLKGITQSRSISFLKL